MIDRSQDGTRSLAIGCFAVFMFALVVCFVVLLPSCCNAQVDPRWRLIQGTDSIVAAPLKDLRTAMGLRMAKNIRVRNCTWELHERGKEINGYIRTIAKQVDADSVKTAIIASYSTDLKSCNEGLAKAEQKLRRRNPLLFAALGAAGALVIINAIK